MQAPINMRDSVEVRAVGGKYKRFTHLTKFMENPG